MDLESEKTLSFWIWAQKTGKAISSTSCRTGKKPPKPTNDEANANLTARARGGSIADHQRETIARLATPRVPLNRGVCRTENRAIELGLYTKREAGLDTTLADRTTATTAVSRRIGARIAGFAVLVCRKIISAGADKISESEAIETAETAYRAAGATHL